MSGTYEHFIYTKHDADKLALAYQLEGFPVEIIDSLTPEYKIVMVYASLDSHLQTTDDYYVVVRIARENDAEYGGGGAYVGSIESLVNPEDKP